MGGDGPGTTTRERQRKQRETPPTASEVEGALDRLLDGMDINFRELVLLARLGEPVDPSELMDDVLNPVYDLLGQHLTFDRLCVALIDPTHKQVMAVWHRSTTPAPALSAGFSQPLTKTSLQSLVDDQKPRVIDDLRAYVEEHPDSESTRRLVIEGLRSSLTCPLVFNGETLGFVFFSSQEPNAYSTDGLDQYERLGARLATVVEKLHLCYQLLLLERGAPRERTPTPTWSSATSHMATERISTVTAVIYDEDHLSRAVARHILGEAGYRLREVPTLHDLHATLYADPLPNLVMIGILHLEEAVYRDFLSLLGAFAARHIPVLILIPEDHTPHVNQWRKLCFAHRHPLRETVFRPVSPAEMRAKAWMLVDGTTTGYVDVTALPKGKLFARRYQILGEVGAGSYGTVYRVRDVLAASRSTLALKVIPLSPARARDPHYLSAILREAYAQSRLEHPNIVRLHDFGQWAGSYYMALDYIDGETVESVVHRRGPMPEPALVNLGMQVCSALSYMARFELVHRDIKASNIMLTPNSEVKILDFGLMRGGTDDSLNDDSTFVGTPAYVSPEGVLRIANLDIRADVYSLGVVLYLGAAGKLPFDAKSTVELCQKHVRDKPPPLMIEAPHVSDGFAELVHQMMRKSRVRRPGPEAVFKRLQTLAGE